MFYWFVLNRVRELSRMCVLPLTEEASGPIDSDLDDLMDVAGSSIGHLIKLKKSVRDTQLDDTFHFICGMLPEEDAGRRIATSYALLIQLSYLVWLNVIY